MQIKLFDNVEQQDQLCIILDGQCWNTCEAGGFEVEIEENSVLLY